MGDTIHPVIASLPGALGLALALSVPDDVVSRPVALAVTGLGLVLGLVGELVSIVAAARSRSLVAPAPDDGRTP
jgi:hypothetical protein